MDLRGAVVTCDALNTQRKLAQFLINTKHCDYCFAVKKKSARKDALFKAAEAAKVNPGAKRARARRRGRCAP